MSKNKMNYGEVIVLVEKAIKHSDNLTIVCNGRLAEWLVEYIGIEYPEFSDNCQFDKDVDEYYITFQTVDGELIITCEFARWENGWFKKHEIPRCFYFVFIDNWRELSYAISSNIIAVCDLVEEEDVEFECDDDCDDDCDCDDSDEFCNCDDCLVEEYTKLIVEASPCTHCVSALLESFAEEIRDNNN